jgi:hypothetical protein
MACHLRHLRIAAHLPVWDAADGRQHIQAELRPVYRHLHIEFLGGPGQVIADLARSLGYGIGLFLLHGRKVGAWKVHAGNAPIAILGDAYAAYQCEIGKYPGPEHESGIGRNRI